MSLLLDRILSADLEVPDITLLESATVLEASNVAAYLYGTNRKDLCSLNKDFPNIAPPWPNFFIEFAMPSTVCMVAPEGSEMVPWEGPQAFGLHWMAGARGSHDFHLQQTLFKSLSDTALPEVRPIYLRAAEEAAWFGHVHLYSESHAFHPDGPVWLLLFPITAGGRFFECDHPEYGDSSIVAIEMPAEPIRWPLPIKPTIQRVIWMAIGASLMTLSLCHCKNVLISPTTPPVRLSKKFERKHGKPLVQYNIINIQPMIRILDVEGNASGDGLKHALHICRGHFKDYQVRGLFGREYLRGRYWWPAHVRGDPEQGFIVSDYTVTRS